MPESKRYNGGAMCRTRKKRLKKKVEQEMYTKQSERRYLECRERAEAEETQESRARQRSTSPKSSGQSPRKERQGSEHILRCIKDISRTGKREK